ncbi:MAG: hypothetical protein EP297_08400 [Gammaproteobacteria bacterium]|nr:MAG: hypothetical protein EP297_08400 [Gammaproteobacteria bacterium]
MQNMANNLGYLNRILSSRWMISLYLIVILQAPANAFNNDINEILELDEEPSGVVIEIVESNEEALRMLLPEIKQIIDQLHDRFPRLSIAIVSHGREQFALTKNNTEENQDIHNGIRQLVDNDIDVHVCGTHASWYDVSPEDFPDYVDVAPAGPAQINDYRNLGYIHIQL